MRGMGVSMTKIDVDRWERREAYEFFSRISNPFYMVTFRADVTPLYAYTKPRGLSFYKGMIWACTEALNSVEAFRMAIRDGQVILLSRRDPSFTDLGPGSGQFRIVTVPHTGDIDSFCREADRVSRAQRSFIDPAKESDALVYYSCLPWIELTALTNERDLSAPGALEDSIPRVAWGKYEEEGGRKKLGLSMEVNHRLIDGIHIGQFAQRLQELMEGLEPHTV